MRFALHISKRALASHRGSDPGALGVAQGLAKGLGAPLHAGEVSRLLIDLNRSLHHRSLFAPGIAALSSDVRLGIEQRYYAPFRAAVRRSIEDCIAARGFALHLSVHSFTPTLAGQTRNADIGLLYDPSRQAERAIVQRLQRALAAALPTARIRRNYPYRGTADGHTTHLRRVFRQKYAGVELELNQAWLSAPAARTLIRGLVLALSEGAR